MEINETLMKLDLIAGGECIGDDGPPYCDDKGKPCNVCIARNAINEIGEILDKAIKEIEV